MPTSSAACSFSFRDDGWEWIERRNVGIGAGTSREEYTQCARNERARVVKTDGNGIGTDGRVTFVFDRRATRERVGAKRATRVITPAKIDRQTGFIESDNTGMGNIFAIEPKQLYTESPTSDKYAKQGLGGVGGAIVALGVVAAVAFATTSLSGFEEANNEFANYNGQSVSYYETEFK